MWIHIFVAKQLNPCMHYTRTHSSINHKMDLKWIEMKWIWNDLDSTKVPHLFFSFSLTLTRSLTIIHGSIEYLKKSLRERRTPPYNSVIKLRIERANSRELCFVQLKRLFPLDCRLFYRLKAPSCGSCIRIYLTWLDSGRVECIMAYFSICRCLQTSEQWSAFTAYNIT